MTTPSDEPRLRRMQDQFALAQTAFREDADESIVLGCQVDADGNPDFYHQDDAVFVRGDQVEFATRRLGAWLDPRREGREGREGYGYALLGVEPQTAQAKVERLRARGGTSAAEYNHILSVASTNTNGGGNLCPADEPDVPADPTLTPRRGQGECAGEGVKVLVIDTGLVEGAAERLGITGTANLAGNFDDSRGYRGHGTFVAGVLLRVAPAVDLHVDNAFYRAGALRESDLVDALDEVLDNPERMPDIISFSAGGYFEGSKPGTCLSSVISRLLASQERVGKPVLVAAAGNEGRDGDRPGVRPFLPAGVPGIISVGALRQDGTGVACFSNHGRWVQAYAPGERLVNAFYTGVYEYQHKPQHACIYQDPPWYPGCTCIAPHAYPERAEFHGVARWSGTSFATPIIAGLIAARMSRTRRRGHPENAAEAAKWLLAHPHTNVDGHLKVFLPDQDLG